MVAWTQMKTGSIAGEPATEPTVLPMETSSANVTASTGRKTETRQVSSTYSLVPRIYFSLAAIFFVSRLTQQHACMRGLCCSFISNSCGGSCDNVAAGKTPRCNDNCQNGDETGVDCGGSCLTPCHCWDGVRTGDEDAVDCGGSCLPSRLPCHCSNGSKNTNKGETNVDCGGPCLPCHCFDGEHSPHEVGVDCGGVCRFPCACLDGRRNGLEDEADNGRVCSQRASRGTEPTDQGSAREHPFYKPSNLWP